MASCWKVLETLKLDEYPDMEKFSISNIVMISNNEFAAAISWDDGDNGEYSQHKWSKLVQYDKFVNTDSISTNHKKSKIHSTVNFNVTEHDLTANP